jgi:membrane fusion protein (multidrug efflux system)
MSKKSIGLLVILAGALALTLAAWLHWRHGRIFPSTSDAYVGGDVVTVSSRIPGTLTAVAVRENDVVAAGQVIAELDPRDYDQAVAETAADLEKARTTLELDRAQIAGAQAQIGVARSEAAQARADRERFADLQRTGSIPARQSEQAATAADVADSRLDAARKALAAAQAKLDVDEKDVGQKQAKHDKAVLQRSYCTVTAPSAGMIADKSALPGQVVAAGQPLCRVAAIDDGHLWVDANFKETQIARIRPGQPAEIEVHAQGDRVYHGKVEAISAGTGASFSLLPPENATGNWVEIVQRVPVRILLDPNEAPERGLRLGLSAHVTVDTRSPGES